MSIAAPVIAPHALRVSYNLCEQLTRQAAKNFYYGLRLLPEPKRSAMFALYAYMRRVDDIADEEDGRTIAQRSEELDQWQAQSAAAIEGMIDVDGRSIWPAFANIVQRYNIPSHLFDDAIAGQRQDLARASYETFDDLGTYCYQVAGVIGLASIHIWGFEGGSETESFAIDRGVAFQLTNILRDLREDALRGRCYLPRQEMREVGTTEHDLLCGRGHDKLVQLMRRQIERARSLYERSAPLEERIEGNSRPTLRAMTEIYRGLLDKISADPMRVLSQRVSLSVFSKLRIGWRAVRAK